MNVYKYLVTSLNSFSERQKFRQKKRQLDEAIIELAKMKAQHEHSQTLLTAQIVALNHQRAIVHKNFEDYHKQQEEVIKLVREYNLFKINDKS